MLVSSFVLFFITVRTAVNYHPLPSTGFRLDGTSSCLKDTRSNQKRKKAIIGGCIPTEMLFATLLLKGNLSPFLKNIVCTLWLEISSKYTSAQLFCWKGISHTCLIIWYALDIISPLTTSRQHSRLWAVLAIA